MVNDFCVLPSRIVCVWFSISLGRFCCTFLVIGVLFIFFDSLSLCPSPVCRGCVCCHGFEAYFYRGFLLFSFAFSVLFVGLSLWG